VSGAYIPQAIRLDVIQQSGNRCGYCLAPQELLYGPLEFEHLLPRSLGGMTVEENL
jgi:5-methylcytosine-specific restriction endonuclease McrA